MRISSESKYQSNRFVLYIFIRSKLEISGWHASTVLHNNALIQINNSEKYYLYERIML